jgi:hypothetical protein
MLSEVTPALQQLNREADARDKQARPRGERRLCNCPGALYRIASESFFIAGTGKIDAASMTFTISAHVYEVRPRKIMNSRLINLV